jgi:DNA-binding GntR family transcriptional regulator
VFVEERLLVSPKNADDDVQGEYSSKVSTVVGLITERVRSGELALGERLVEAQLARLAGVGIGPVREALQILSGSGVVNLALNRGARVGTLTVGEGLQILSLQIHLIAIVFVEPDQRSRWGAVSPLLRDVRSATADVAKFARALVDFLTSCLNSAPNRYLRYATANLSPVLVIRALQDISLQDSQRKLIAKSLNDAVVAVRAKSTEALQDCLFQIIEVLRAELRVQPSPATRPSTTASDGAAARVMHHIIESIRRNRIVLGQRLVEADIMSETGIGRTPVRQALRTLSGRHFIELMPNRGARVRRLSRADLTDILLVLEQVSRAAFRELHEIGISDKLRKASSIALRAMEAAALERQPYKFMSSLVEIHRVLNEHAGNPFLNRTFDVLHTEFFLRELSELMTIRHWDQYLTRYRKIMGFVLAGKPVRAATEFSAHIQDLLHLLASGQDELVY